MNDQNDVQGALNVQPPHSVFQIDAKDSQNKHEIINTTDKRHAYKVKSSNNDHYRVSTVYGFVEPQAKVVLDIHRLPGGKAQPDKFVVQWAEVPQNETNPKAPFIAQAQSGEVVFTVESKEQPAPKKS